MKIRKYNEMSNILKNTFKAFGNYHGLLMLAMLVLCSFGMVDSAFAGDPPTGGGGGGGGAAGGMLAGLTTMLTTITEEISGPLGKVIGICVVIGIGFMFLTGRMDWVSALMMIAGVAIIIAAATISTELIGGA